MGDPRLWRGVRVALDVATVVVVVVDGADAGSLSRRHDSTPSASRGVARCQSLRYSILWLCRPARASARLTNIAATGRFVLLVNSLSVGVWGS